MSKRTAKTEEILDAAEAMVRTGGYNAFSYRDVAKEVGIKASSVHYHFPSKENLGAALARRYTEKFIAALGTPGDEKVSPEKLLRVYIDSGRRALNDEGLMCLCGVLGAEVGDLPKPVADEAKIFFERNIEWLDAVLSRLDGSVSKADRKARAMRIVALLEGGMILARSLGDIDAFDAVTRNL